MLSGYKIKVEMGLFLVFSELLPVYFFAHIHTNTDGASRALTVKKKKLLPSYQEPVSSCLCALQVNGVNIESMRHAEVVAFIKKGGDETWLLVVDPDTDENFKRRGVIPTVSHLRGRTALTEG